MKNRIAGWQKVYRFTLLQSMKSKSVIMITVIYCLIALASIPLLGTMNQKSNKEKEPAKTEEAKTGDVETLFVYNQTAIPFDQILRFDEMDYKGAKAMKVEYCTGSFEDKEKAMEGSEEKAIALLMTQDPETGMLDFTAVYSGKSGLNHDKVSSFMDSLHEIYYPQLYEGLGINEEQVEFFTKELSTETVTFTPGEGIGEKKTGSRIGLVEYFLTFGLMMFVMMFNGVASEQVSGTIVQEKSSKVVEFLLTSVKPLALLIGKILAVLTVIFGEFVLMGLCFILSDLIYVGVLGGEANVKAIINDMLSSQVALGETSAHFSFGAVLPAILVIIMGLMFFAVLAGLCGASVDKMDDLQEAMKIYSMFLVLSMYLGMAVMITDMLGANVPVLRYIAFLFPGSAVFILPAYMIIGKVSFGIGLLAMVIMLACLLLLVMFAASIYEVLIYHRGEPVKLKNMLAIAFEQGGKKGGSHAQ